MIDRWLLLCIQLLLLHHWTYIDYRCHDSVQDCLLDRVAGSKHCWFGYGKGGVDCGGDSAVGCVLWYATVEARGGVFADVVIILLSLVVCWVGSWVYVWYVCFVIQLVVDRIFVCWVYVSSFLLNILAFWVVVDILVIISSSSLETWSRI